MSLRRRREAKAWKNFQARKTPESLIAWQRAYLQVFPAESFIEQKTSRTSRRGLNVLAVFFVGIVILLSIISYTLWG